MGKPDQYRPKQGDVILVRATVSRVTGPVGGWGTEEITRAAGSPGTVKIAARTDSNALVRCAIDDIEAVESFAIGVGCRVRWWEEGEHHAGNVFRAAAWVYGEVLAVDEAEDEADRPSKDNLWIKVEGRLPRLTKQRKSVERA